LRLLEKAAIVERYSIENLGFEKEQLEIFLKVIRRPWGMVLITDRRKRKSTTLHTALKFIKVAAQERDHRRGPRRVPTSPGIQQVQVKAEIGPTSRRSLRSILRQDPDIIMLGEIRDPETAQIAVKAALTGHLVLSTLHTNDAVSTLVRLIISASSLFCRLRGERRRGQRLVRKICNECKETYRRPRTSSRCSPPDPGPRCSIVEPGAGAARNVGLFGRMALYEVFAVGRRSSHAHRPRRRDKISATLSSPAMITLRQCGFRQPRAGSHHARRKSRRAADTD